MAYNSQLRPKIDLTWIMIFGMTHVLSDKLKLVHISPAKNRVSVPAEQLSIIEHYNFLN